MLRHYTKATASSRAIEAHKRVSPSDVGELSADSRAQPWTICLRGSGSNRSRQDPGDFYGKHVTRRRPGQWASQVHGRVHGTVGLVG